MANITTASNRIEQLINESEQKKVIDELADQIKTSAGDSFYTEILCSNILKLVKEIEEIVRAERIKDPANAPVAYNEEMI